MRKSLFPLQTSVGADLAIWRRASLLAFPGADVTLELTFITMPTGGTVTVSTVTLAVAWNKSRTHIYKPLSSPNHKVCLLFLFVPPMN